MLEDGEIVLDSSNELEPIGEMEADACHGGPRPVGHKTLLLLLLIVLLGVSVRLLHLGAQSVWYDEAFSVAHSARALPELFRVLIRDVVHPPLHYVILHGWFQIAGFGPVQARLVSVIFGTLSIPLLFLLARRFTDSGTSLCAALLLAISQIAVYFSQEARPYAQTQFFSLLAALAFFPFLEKPDFRRSLLFGVAAALLMYTHYYGAGTLLALGVYWLIFRRDYSPRVFRRLAAIVLFLFAAFIPWIFAVQSERGMSQKMRAWSGIERPSLFAPIGMLNRFNNGKFESFETESTGLQVLTGVAVFTLPALGAFWCAKRRQRQGVVLGYLLSAIPIAMAISLGILGTIFNYRHCSFSAPGYYLAVAIGGRTCFRNSNVRWAWLAVASVLSVVALRANYVVTKPDYRAGFLPLADHYRPGDCVVARPTVWYRRIHFAWEVYYRDRPLRLVPLESLPDGLADCERLWTAWDRTWWMNTEKGDSPEYLRASAILSEYYAIVERFSHPAIELQLLNRRSTTPRQGLRRDTQTAVPALP